MSPQIQIRRRTLLPALLTSRRQQPADRTLTASKAATSSNGNIHLYTAGNIDALDCFIENDTPLIS
jgi:hypothetical protein